MKSRDPKGPGSAPVFMLVLSLLVSVCLVGAASTALAGNNPSAKAVVHVRAHNAKAGCNPGFDLATATCSTFVTTEAGFSVDAFPVFFNLTEFLGCEYGLDWPAWTYSAAFSNCSDLIIGGIIWPGEGASHTWLACQTGVCVPSFVWLYADGPGQICLSPHPIGAAIKVLDCAEGTDEPIATFCAGVYGALGEDPCVEGALCQVTPTTLAFGTVTVGGTSDLSFVIKNIGGGTLEGEVTTGCTQYSIQSGGGAYALAAGESVIVEVRFEPAVAGYDECTILTGADCADVTCTGTGEDAPVCEVTPETLDFGTVTIGQFAGQNFTIRNAGGGTLEGEVSEACGDYSITSSEGAFSLGAGQQIIVGVRFTPTTPGYQECTVETGQAICADVTCSGTGEDPPECEVVPSTIDLGTVTVGAFKDTTFRITNIGGGILTGEPGEACADFEIRTGDEPYALGNGESHYVELRFTPSASGPQICRVGTGTDCDSVTVSAMGEDPPVCEVSTDSLDFGTVQVGEFQDLSFFIENVGGGILSGTPGEQCADFAIVGGDGPFELESGESVEITVRFAPTSGGTKTCQIDPHSDEPIVRCLCWVPVCSETGYADLVGFSVAHPESDFLELEHWMVWMSPDVPDAWVVEGNVTGALPDTAWTDSLCMLTDGTNELFSFTITDVTGACCATFPTECDHFEFETHPHACHAVICTGIGEEAPECQVTPTALDFGTLTVGESADRVFTIENIGEGLLTGEVSEPCDYYQVISGGGAYSLGAGETRDVTVRFSPVLAGDFACEVLTGTFCDNVACDGSAEAMPVYVDVRPGVCPNKIRVDGPFSIPVAVLGTADFSVIDVDPATVTLTREGVAAEVSPGSWNLTDVGTPFMGSLCDCHALSMDGFQDLRFRFRIADVSATLNLGPLAGSEVPLTLSGNLVTGEEIEGADCVLVIGGLFGEDVFAGDLGVISHSGLSPKTSTIRFSYYTKEDGHIVLEIFDVQGRTVATLVDEVKPSGIYEVSWDGRTRNGGPIPAGVYFARISNGSASSTEKVMILK